MRRLFFFFTEPSKSTETGLSGRDPFPRAPFSLLLDIGTLAQSPGDLGRGHDALTASPSTLDPGTCGQAQGHAARPRDAGRLGEKRNLRGGVREEASERRRLVAFCSGLLLLLRGPLPQLWELWVPLPGTPPPPLQFLGWAGPQPCPACPGKALELPAGAQ